MQILHTSPGLEDIWQLHWAYAAGMEWNTPGLFIANIEDPAAIAAFLTRPAQAVPDRAALAADEEATPARLSGSKSRHTQTGRLR